MSRISRRTVLGGAVAGASFLVTRPVSGAGTSAPTSPEATPPDRPIDQQVVPLINLLIDLSRDAEGRAHIERAAFITSTAHCSGTLPVTQEEATELLKELAKRDFTVLRVHGLRIAGQPFTLIRSDEDEAGPFTYAARRGEFVIARVFRQRVGPSLKSGVVVATSSDGMAAGNAVEAVYQFVQKVR